MKNKAVFVDRDDTINIDVGYLDDPSRFEMISGVGKGVKMLKDDGFKIIIVTNQSGIARGYFTEKQLLSIHERMRREFQKFNVTLDGIYYCPHHPDDNCCCRKPKIGLFEMAIKDHDINIKKSYVLGDKILDTDAGRKIGAITVLIPNPHMKEDIMYNKDQLEYNPDYIADDFLSAVKWILKG